MSTATKTIAHDLHECAEELAKRCDGAIARDGQGFNKFDRRFGMVLADSDPEEWSDRQTLKGYEMLHKYRKQLDDYGYDFESIPKPTVEEEEEEVEFVDEDSPAKKGTKDYKILAEDDNFVFDFPKDDEVIQDIKSSLVGREFDWDDYLWSAPAMAQNASEVARIADEHDFAITAEAAAILESFLEGGSTSSRVVEIDGNMAKLYFPPRDRLLNTVKSLPLRKFEDAEGSDDEPHWKVPLSLPVIEDLQYIINAFEFKVEGSFEDKIEQMQRRFEWSGGTDGERLDVEDELPHDLFPFQRPAVRYALEAKRMMIGDDMGSGKTIMALATAKAAGADQLVVICPSSVKINWAKETMYWTDLRPSICESMTPEPMDPMQVLHDGDRVPVQVNDYSADVMIINYDILKPHMSKLKRGNDMTVVDEAHYIKNKDANRSQNSKKLLRDAEYQILLTGTPVRNRPKEIYHPLLAIKQAGAFDRPLGDFWHFHKTYCLPGDAPITMADLSEKPISEVEVGDEVLAFDKSPEESENGNRRLQNAEVEDIFVRKAELQKVTLEDGTELKCTPDHRWLTGRNDSTTGNLYQKAQEGRLGGRGRGCASRIAQIIPEDFEEPKYSLSNGDYAKGYLAGYFQGDGWTSKEDRIHTHPTEPSKSTQGTYGHSVGAADSNNAPIDRVETFLSRFGLDYTRDKRSDGLHEIRISHEEGYNFINQLHADENVKAFLSGFLGGIYDAEGFGQIICQYQGENPITFRMIRDYLKRFGFEPRVRSDKETIRIMGGRSEFLRFWRVANPSITEKLKAQLMNSGGKFMLDQHFVTDVEPLDGTHKVYTLKTSTGTYIAYGLGSRNCDGHKTQWGWDFDGASNLDELNETLRTSCYVRRDKADILDQLPAKHQMELTVEIDNRSDYDWASEAPCEFLYDMITSGDRPDLVDEARKQFDAPLEQALEKIAEQKVENDQRAEHMVRLMLLRQLAAEGKLGATKEWAKEFLNGGEKLVIFAVHRLVQERLMDMFDEPAAILSKMGVQEREENIERFQTDPDCKVMVCSLHAAKEGIDGLQDASSTSLFVEYPWSPGDLKQAEARLHRAGQDKQTDIYYMVGQNTIDEYMREMLQNKREVMEDATSGTDQTGSVIDELAQNGI